MFAGSVACPAEACGKTKSVTQAVGLLSSPFCCLTSDIEKIGCWVESRGHFPEKYNVKINGQWSCIYFQGSDYNNGPGDLNWTKKGGQEEV